MGLRIYTVHLPTSSLREVIAAGVPQLVKEGFSWPAFFFSVPWALWHRLWIEAAALIALFLAVGVILDFVDAGDSIEAAVMIAIAVLIGGSGNTWRRESLRRRGFIDGGVVSGRNSETALCRYLDLRAAAVRVDQPVVRPTAPFPQPAMVAAPAGGDSFAGTGYDR